MITVLLVATAILCLVYWFFIYSGMKNDEMRVKGFRSYSDEVQQIVLNDKTLAQKVHYASPVAVFCSNLALFSIVFLGFGFLFKQEELMANFLTLLFVGQVLNAFDYFVIDLIWFRKSPRVRFDATKHQPELYQETSKHTASFLKGIVMFALVAAIDSFIISLF